MKTILIVHQKEIIDLYKKSTPGIKVTLEDILGKKILMPDITDRIKSYEDACEELDISPIDEYLLLNNGVTKDAIAYMKIKTITEALNEGWKASSDNENQKKYIPWFHPDSSAGFVFHCTHYYESRLHTGYWLTLCFKSDELATYAGKTFILIYKDLIMGKDE